MADDDIQVVIEDENGSSAEQRELEEARRRADEAKAAADRLAQETQYWRGVKATAQIDNAAATIDSETKAAESEYRAALESGDVDRATQATSRMTTAAAAKMELDRHRQQLQSAAHRQPADPIERYISAASPASQAWLRQHTDWIKDEGKRKQLQRILPASR